MMPTLHTGDVVLVDLARRKPTPPGIFILFDNMELVAKRLEHIPNHEPPKVRVISENTCYRVYECPPDEINTDRRVRWFTWEI
ncbi:S24 family peptidase [Alphaproteobacteria bacterium]|nr:S24 family peptidase [Alphaproteobacteria bacterium]